MNSMKESFEAGTVLLLARELPVPCEWLVVESKRNRVVLWPADGNPWVGTKDVAVAQSPEHDRMTLRGDLEIVVAPEALAGAVAFQTLSESWMAQVRAQRMQSESPTVRQIETDDEPEYREWIGQLRKCAALLVQPKVSRGTNTRARFRLRGPHYHRGHLIGWAAGLMSAGVASLMLVSQSPEPQTTGSLTVHHPPPVSGAAGLAPKLQAKGDVAFDASMKSTSDGLLVYVSSSHAGRVTLYGRTGSEPWEVLAHGMLLGTGEYTLAGEELPLSWEERRAGVMQGRLQISGPDRPTLLAVFEPAPVSEGVLSPEKVEQWNVTGCLEESGQIQDEGRTVFYQTMEFTQAKEYVNAPDSVTTIGP